MSFEEEEEEEEGGGEQEGADGGDGGAEGGGCTGMLPFGFGRKASERSMPEHDDAAALLLLRGPAPWAVGAER